MRRAIVLFAALLLSAAPLAAQATGPVFAPAVRDFVSVDAPVVALTHVTVVDGRGNAPVENQTVIIENGRITAVGQTGRVRVPRGAQVLELRGHTVIPGIVGMHNHTFYTTANRQAQISFSAPRLYLASGVTTVRTTGSYHPYSEINLKRAIDQGQAPGPRMHVTGPYITGPVTGTYMTQVATPEDARRVVAYWAEEGATWFKAYMHISQDALRAAIEEAHRRGLKFTGHLCSVSFREAVALGIDNLEHGLFTNTDWYPGRGRDECPSNLLGSLTNVDVNSPEVRATIRDMIDNNVGMTSTLAVYELYVPNRPPLEDRVLEALSPESRAEYLATREQIAARGAQAPMTEVFRRAQQFELDFVRAGGLLAAGVDPTGNGGALPGFGDQRNYELLIEAGFTPVEAIQIMTYNGARILGEDDQYGSVEPGKLADLVVIRGNPIRNPAEIRNVVTVFKNGVGYDSPKLIQAVRGLVGIR